MRSTNLFSRYPSTTQSRLVPLGLVKYKLVQGAITNESSSIIFVVLLDSPPLRTESVLTFEIISRRLSSTGLAFQSQ